MATYVPKSLKRKTKRNKLILEGNVVKKRKKKKQNKLVINTVNVMIGKKKNKKLEMIYIYI